MKRTRRVGAFGAEGAGTSSVAPGGRTLGVDGAKTPVRNAAKPLAARARIQKRILRRDTSVLS
jgi:hypothetical protein